MFDTAIIKHQQHRPIRFGGQRLDVWSKVTAIAAIVTIVATLMLVLLTIMSQHPAIVLHLPTNHHVALNAAQAPSG